MPGRPYLRAVKERLAKENAEFRRALGGGNYTLEKWETLLPEHVRNEFAARALIASEGDAFRAAVRLGFARLHKPECDEVLERVFGGPGVKAILDRDLKGPEERRQDLIERQIRIALYGDDASATKAFSVLAKTCGWIKSPDVLVQNNRQTILALVTQKNHRGEVVDDVAAIAGGFLEHEPGSATRIDSGEAIALAQGHE